MRNQDFQFELACQTLNAAAVTRNTAKVVTFAVPATIPHRAAAAVHLHA
jgi:hypothetical protein